MTLSTTVIAAKLLKSGFDQWIACGGSGGLSVEKCKVLAGRKIFLFPDLSNPGAKIKCHELWCIKAEEFNNRISGTNFQVSDLLERNATTEERQQGLDLADYLLRFNYEDFLQRKAQKQAGQMFKNEVAFQAKATSHQAQWKKLARKYPNLNILQGRLRLEILCSSAS